MGSLLFTLNILDARPIVATIILEYGVYVQRTLVTRCGKMSSIRLTLNYWHFMHHY